MPRKRQLHPGYSECKTCHGLDLSGSGDAVSCYSCHSYNTEPPFSFHPTSWTDSYLDHRGYAAVNGFNTCTSCHGSTLQGYQTAPSCYSTSFNGQSCHADGPQGVPHPLDESYLLGTNHGPDAKADLTVCQSCHGQPGGPGSNPRFNIGIEKSWQPGVRKLSWRELRSPVRVGRPEQYLPLLGGEYSDCLYPLSWCGPGWCRWCRGELPWLP